MKPTGSGVNISRSCSIRRPDSLKRYGIPGQEYINNTRLGEKPVSAVTCVPRMTATENIIKEMEIEMGILSWIVVGLIAGWLAGLVVKGGGYGCVGDIVVGVIGGLLGGWLATYFFHMSDPMSGINLESILVAFVGAVIFIIVLRLITGRRA